jgi:hypothetical protein
MHNEGNKKVIVSELSKILVVTRDTEKDKDKELAYAGKNTPVIMITSGISNPKVPGQDTPMYNDWHWSDVNKRKAINSECSKEEVKPLHTLVEIAKRRNLVTSVWGKQVKLSNAIKTMKKGKRHEGTQDQETSAHHLNKARSCVVQHTNYNTSMTNTTIVDIHIIEKEVKVFLENYSTAEVGSYSLRGALYMVKMSDGRSLLSSSSIDTHKRCN